MSTFNVTQKRRGRPATGETPQIGVRFPAFQLAAIEAYAEAEGIDRSEAIRRLVEKGLEPPEGRHGSDRGKPTNENASPPRRSFDPKEHRERMLRQIEKPSPHDDPTD